MKKWFVLVLGFAAISAGFLFAKDARVLPAAFTLATYGAGAIGESLPGMFFSLVATAAGPGGAGPIEDSTVPFRTALGWDALYSNTNGDYNVAVGYRALYSNTNGDYNVAVGAYPLWFNTEGSYNTASGYYALFSNTHGDFSTVSGAYALTSNTSGNYNTGNGVWALSSNTEGSYNTASGAYALRSNTSGNDNTAIGVDALFSNTTGIHNTALGDLAGYYCKEGNYNIYLGGRVMGVATDTNTIRIGFPYNSTITPPSGQNQTFIAGIVETALDAGMTPAVVGITGEGRLGTFPTELLPQGPQGPQGPEGPQGAPGEGLISGSLLFLVPSATPPAGYTFLGSYDFSLTVAGSKKPTKLTVNVYQKQ